LVYPSDIGPSFSNISLDLKNEPLREMISHLVSPQKFEETPTDSKLIYEERAYEQRDEGSKSEM